jgi:hypothetical protein
MIIIPFSTHPTEYEIFVVLLDENVSRIKAYDPAEVKAIITPEFKHKKLKTVYIGYCKNEEVRHLLTLAQSGKVVEALKYLTRGFEYKPEQGDHNGPPVSLLIKEKETKQ